MRNCLNCKWTSCNNSGFDKSICEKYIPDNYDSLTSTKEHLAQCKKNLQTIFASNPEIEKAFKETLDEMSKPENVEKMAKEIHRGLELINKIEMRRKR